MNDARKRAATLAQTWNATLPAIVRREIEDEYLSVAEEQRRRGRFDRRVLLVGGAGYVGSVIAGELLACGYQVRCMDLLLYRNDVCALQLLRDPNYEFIYGDHCDPQAVHTALEGVTDVVILSGLVGDPITKTYPDESFAINQRGMEGLITSLNQEGLNRVVFVSTCSNYGLIPENVLASEEYELKPLSLYAQAKVAMEALLLGSRGRVDFSPTVLRFATAFGLSPRMRFDLTVNQFTRDMYLNQPLVVYDANTWRPYCHTKDFANAVRRVLEMGRRRVAFEVFNVGRDDNNCTKQSIVDKVKRHLPNAPVEYKEHGSDPRNYRVDFGKIKRELLFTPEFTVDDGIAEILDALTNRLFDRVEENRPFYGNYEIRYDGLRPSKVRQRQA
jgi:nucleoside-diphosphate-sugar epimerase